MGSVYGFLEHTTPRLPAPFIHRPASRLLLKAGARAISMGSSKQGCLSPLQGVCSASNLPPPTHTILPMIPCLHSSSPRVQTTATQGEIAKPRPTEPQMAHMNILLRKGRCLERRSWVQARSGACSFLIHLGALRRRN